MPEDVPDRLTKFSLVRGALGQWLWDNQIIINGGGNESIGEPGAIPNVDDFIRYMQNPVPPVRPEDMQ